MRLICVQQLWRTDSKLYYIYVKTYLVSVDSRRYFRFWTYTIIVINYDFNKIFYFFTSENASSVSKNAPTIPTLKYL